VGTGIEVAVIFAQIDDGEDFAPAAFWKQPPADLLRGQGKQQSELWPQSTNKIDGVLWQQAMTAKHLLLTLWWSPTLC